MNDLSKSNAFPLMLNSVVVCGGWSQVVQVTVVCHLELSFIPSIKMSAPVSQKLYLASAIFILSSVKIIEITYAHDFSEFRQYRRVRHRVKSRLPSSCVLIFLTSF